MQCNKDYLLVLLGNITLNVRGNSMKTMNFKKSLLVTAMIGSLAGCNLDSSQADADTFTSKKYQGNGVSTGKVTRKRQDSVTVNGIAFDVSGASINLDGKNGTADDIKLGQVVSIKANYNEDGTATASQLVYDDSLQGPVDSVNVAANSLVVLGQTILVDNETLLEGLELATLQAGQIVEISGLANAQGQWQASFIGLSDQTLTEFDVAGTISELNTGATTFKINGLLVDYSQVGELDYVQQIISDGALVDLYGTMDTTDVGEPVLIAQEIESEEAFMADDGDLLEIEGFISSALVDGQFEVAGLKVKVNNNTFFDIGDASLLKVDASIEIEGTVNEDGSINALYIFVEPDDEIEVAAIIEAIDLENNTVTVLGKTFHINESTWIADDDMEDWNENKELEGDFNEADFNESDFNEDDFNEANFNEADFNEDSFAESNFNEDDYGNEDWDEDDFNEDDWDDAEDTLKLSDLAVGDYVELSAYLNTDQQTLVALYMARLPADEAQEVYLSAQVSNIQVEDQSFQVLGQTVNLTTANIELFSVNVSAYEDYENYEEEYEFNEDDMEMNEYEDEEEMNEGDMEMNEEDLDEGISALNVDDFMSLLTTSSQVFLMGNNQSGTIIWQDVYIEVE